MRVAWSRVRRFRLRSGKRSANSAFESEISMTDSEGPSLKQDGQELDSSDSVESALSSMERELKGLTDLVTGEGETSVPVADAVEEAIEDISAVGEAISPEAVDDILASDSPLTSDSPAAPPSDEAAGAVPQDADADEVATGDIAAAKVDEIDALMETAVSPDDALVEAQATAAEGDAPAGASLEGAAFAVEETEAVSVETDAPAAMDAAVDPTQLTQAEAADEAKVQGLDIEPVGDGGGVAEPAVNEPIMEVPTPGEPDAGDATTIAHDPGDAVEAAAPGDSEWEPISEVLARAESASDAVTRGASEWEQSEPAPVSAAPASPALSAAAIQSALKKTADVSAESEAQEVPTVTAAELIQPPQASVPSAVPSAAGVAVAHSPAQPDGAEVDHSVFEGIPAMSMPGTHVHSEEQPRAAEWGSTTVHPTPAPAASDAPPVSAPRTTDRGGRRAPADRTWARRPRAGRASHDQVQTAIANLADFLLDEVNGMWGEAREGLEELFADLEEAKRVKDEVDGLHREIQAMRDDLNASRREARQLHTQVQNLRDDAARARQRADTAALDAQAAADRAVAAAREAELTARLDRGV
jgi:hypothetical protein